IAAPGQFKKVEARAVRHVRAPLDGDGAKTLRKSKRQIHRVQHQTRGSGSTYGEVIVAGGDRSRLEHQVRTPLAGPLEGGLADGSGGTYARQVLRLQARPAAPGTNVPQVKRLARDERQRQAGAQNLPAAFADRAVQFYGRLCHANRRTESRAEFTRKVLTLHRTTMISWVCHCGLQGQGRRGEREDLASEGVVARAPRLQALAADDEHALLAADAVIYQECLAGESRVLAGPGANEQNLSRSERDIPRQLGEGLAGLVQIENPT